jgi:hypothetical protein
VWKKKKTNGLASAAGLISAEIAKRDLVKKEKAERAIIVEALKLIRAGKPASHAVPVPRPTDLTGFGDDKGDAGLPPPSTTTLRLEDTTVMKRTRGKTLDFVALQNGTATKKGKAQGVLKHHECRIWRYYSYIYSPNGTQGTYMTECRRMTFPKHSRTYSKPPGFHTPY